MGYTKVIQPDEDGNLLGYFQEMPEYFTNGEENTIESCNLWLDYLLVDLQVWCEKGIIPALPQPTDNGATDVVISKHWVFDVDEHLAWEIYKPTMTTYPPNAVSNIKFKWLRHHFK